jgi:hypothetical protein
MKSNWGREDKTEAQEEYPTEDALAMCKGIQIGQVDKYLEWLNKRPTQEIVGRLLGIIHSKSSLLPIVCAEEKPPIQIDGINFDPIQNSQARRMTKITLLLLIHDASKRMGVWDKIQQQWTEKYILETKTQVRIAEAMAKQFEDDGQMDIAANLRKGIEGIKEANKKYRIEW